MPSSVVVTFKDGSTYTYDNVPDGVTPEEVTERASSKFSDRGGVAALEKIGGKKTVSDINNPESIGDVIRNSLDIPVEANYSKAIATGIAKPSLLTSREGVDNYNAAQASGDVYTQEQLDKLPFPYRAASNVSNYLSDPLTAGFAAAQAVSPWGKVANLGKYIAEGVLPTIGSEEAMRTARENDVGAVGELGSGLAGGVATAYGTKNATGALSAGAKATFSGSDTVRNLKAFFKSNDSVLIQKALKENPMLIENMRELTLEAEKLGIQNLPPVFSLASTPAGVSELQRRISVDPEGMRLDLATSVDNLGAAIQKRIGDIAAPQTSISDAYSTARSEYQNTYRRWNANDDTFMSAYTNEKLAPYNKLMENFSNAEQKLLRQFQGSTTGTTREVVDSFKMLEGNRRKAAKATSDKLYNDAYTMASEAGANGRPSPDSITYLKQQFADIETGVFDKVPALQREAERVFGKKTGLLQANGRPLTTDLTLEDLHTLRQRVGDLYTVDPYRSIQLKQAIDASIDTIQDSRVKTAWKDAQSFNSAKVQAPKDMEAFNKLSPEQLDTTVATYFGDRQSLNEYLFVHDASPQAVQVADMAVRHTIYKSIIDENGNVDNRKLAAYFSNKDNLDYISVLPKEQREALLASGSDLISANKFVYKQQEHIYALQKEMADDVFKRIYSPADGTNGLDNVAKAILPEGRVRDSVLSQLSAYEAKTGNTDIKNALKLRVTEEAFNQPNPWEWITKPEHINLFKSLYGKEEFNSLQGMSKLAKAYSNVGEVMRGTKTQAGSVPPNLQVPFTGGQSVQSVISLLFQPFYSPLYAATALTGRAVRNTLTEMDKKAGIDVLMNAETFNNLLNYRKQGRQELFLQELGKLYQKRMAIESLYSGSTATVNAVDSEVYQQ